jgi:hypothetical protein
MLFKDSAICFLSSLKPFEAPRPVNFSNNDRSRHVFIFLILLLGVHSFRILIDLEAILAIPQNLDLEVSSVFGCGFLCEINVGCIVVDLS